MDSKKKMKKLTIILCIIGAVMLLFGGYIILRKNISPSKKETTANATTDTEELVTGDSNSADDSNPESMIQPSTELSAHEINSEVYKWPCGNERYQGWEEPRQVTEFAKYKEYYEQIAQQFLEYEGKDVYFYATDDMVYYDECKNEGSVKVTYDKKKLMDLLEKSEVESICVSNDYITFYNNFSYDNYIMYFYDETLTYSVPFPSDENSWITGSMVNIAPHWWWENLESWKH